VNKTEMRDYIDSLKQRVHFKVESWDAALCGPDGLPLDESRRLLTPKLVFEDEGNMLMYGGASCQWQTLIGNGTTTAGQALTYFNNAQAAIGVGDSSTAAAATQTNLQGAATPANRIRKAMNATYPLHTDGVVVGAASIVFQSTFATGEANFTWNEWGLFNSVTDAVGRMLNRRVVNLGTKTSAAAWDFTITLTLA
jgi:hypothetical protein